MIETVLAAVATPASVIAIAVASAYVGRGIGRWIVNTAVGKWIVATFRPPPEVSLNSSLMWGPMLFMAILSGKGIFCFWQSLFRSVVGAH